MELDDIANEEEQNEQLESNTVQDYSPVMHASKTVKLFSGEVIKLSPRVFNTTTIDETQLKGTYMDMDSLTTRANLRNSIKEQNRRKQVENPTSTTKNCIHDPRFGQRSISQPVLFSYALQAMINNID